MSTAPGLRFCTISKKPDFWGALISAPQIIEGSCFRLGVTFKDGASPETLGAPKDAYRCHLEAPPVWMHVQCFGPPQFAKNDGGQNMILQLSEGR